LAIVEGKITYST